MSNFKPFHSYGCLPCETATLRDGPQLPYILAVEVLKLLLPRLGHQCGVKELAGEVISESLVILDLQLQHVSTGAREVVATARR